MQGYFKDMFSNSGRFWKDEWNEVVRLTSFPADQQGKVQGNSAQVPSYKTVPCLLPSPQSESAPGTVSKWKKCNKISVLLDGFWNMATDIGYQIAKLAWHSPSCRLWSMLQRLTSPSPHLTFQSTSGTTMYIQGVLWVKSAGEAQSILLYSVDAFCQALTFQVLAECLLLASKRKELTFHSCFSTSAE